MTWHSRIVALAIIFVMVFYISSPARVVLRRMAAGRELARQGTAFSVQHEHARLRVLIAGDSTAVGTGSVDPRASVAGRLAADLPDATVINIGINGLRTGEISDRLGDRSSEHFDLILLQTGGNDVLRFTPKTRLRRDLRRLLRTARRMSDRVVVMSAGNVGLAPIFPRPLGWLYTHRARLVRTILQEVVPQEGGVFVDVFAERKDDIFLTDPPRYYAPDFFHPSGDGYEVWYRQLRTALTSTGILSHADTR